MQKLTYFRKDFSLQIANRLAVQIDTNGEQPAAGSSHKDSCVAYCRVQRSICFGNLIPTPKCCKDIGATLNSKTGQGFWTAEQQVAYNQSIEVIVAAYLPYLPPLE